MAFIGAINDKLRRYFYTQAPHLEGKRCYIGCSGNFTIEQLISRRCERAEIHSNDVSLYSSVIGRALLGEVLEANVINDELRWAEEYYRRGPVESVSVILLLLEMLKFEKRRNPYQERMWRHYLSAWDSLFETTSGKVEKALSSIRIREYTAVDVHDYYPRPDGVSIGFLPTYVGGYEKLFEVLEESFRWNTPRYQLLTEERREETVSRMAEGEYILYDDRPRDLPCIARVELFGKRTVYIYSNLGVKRGVFRRRLGEKIRNYELLMPDDEFPDDAGITFQPTEGPVVNHYRNLFLSKKIQPASGDPNIMVFVGGKLFGFLIFQSYSLKGRAGDNSIYLLSDFVVPSRRYRRLAKLLLMTARTKEIREYLQDKLVRRVDYMLTTAFTDKPVSMKYRGVFDLVKRGKGFLNYKGEFDDITLKEVLPRWRKKYGKR